ncbi:MAG TPA: hypothetical protein VN132_03750, partial [Bdellovibrio sp.]|nr:hypothetical protein [Bdellovibrio sp.]
FNDAYQVQAVSHFTILPNDREKKEYLPALTQSIDLNQNTDCESHCFDGATNIIQIQQDLSSLGDDGVAKRVLIRQEYNNKDGVSIVFRGECARTL